MQVKRLLNQTQSWRQDVEKHFSHTSYEKKQRNAFSHDIHYSTILEIYFGTAYIYLDIFKPYKNLTGIKSCAV